MSGIAGYCEFGRAAVSAEITAVLGIGIAQCGDDGSAQLERGAAVLLQRAFHTGRSPEPPQHYDADGVSIVWDGRIDNRDELAARTGSASRADAELLAALYRRDPHGDFVAPVAGDFSFALWDAPRRTLILGRDAFGVRPLFYHASAGRVAWATKIDPLLDPLLGIDQTIDDEYLGAYVIHSADAEETPFRAIRAVPPGAMVVATPEGTTIRRFWSLDALPDVTLRSDGEYEERLLELLRDSVAARLQTDRPVASELSGGLDSSTIVCLAAALLRERAVPAPRVFTISYVFDEAKISDERRYITEVEQAVGQQGIHLREEDHRLLSNLADTPSPLYPTPQICFMKRYRDVGRTMEAAGARTLLRGTGGDQVLWGEADQVYEPWDHFSAGRFGAMHRSLRAWAPALRTSYFELLRRSVLRPLLGRPLGRVSGERRVPWWISPEFARRTRLRERVQDLSAPDRTRPRSWRAQAKMIDSLRSSFILGFPLERGTIDATYPFLHRPLVEFCLGIPLEQKLRPGQTRSVLRRAMRGILPDAIAKRRSKAGPDAALVRAFVREWPVLHEMFSSSRAAAHGIIDRDTFLGALTRARHGLEVHRPSFIRLISIECWLRTLEQRRLRDAA